MPARPFLSLAGRSGDSLVGPCQPNIEAIRMLHIRADENLSRYHRPIETVSSLLGRPAFFYGIVLFVTLWVFLNVLSPRFGVAPLTLHRFFGSRAS